MSVLIDGGVETEDVETNATLEIEFSEPIAEDTLTTGTIHVTVAGHEIAGEVAVNDATHATFTPLERYYLLGEHMLTVTTDVTDVDGTALEEDYEFSFRVREGAWTHMPSVTPDPLPNAGVDPLLPALGVDGAGNVLVAWAGVPTGVYARWYRQDTGWGQIETLREVTADGPAKVAVNRNGDAIVAYADDSSVSAYQYRRGAWLPVTDLYVGEPDLGLISVAISDVGEAHLVAARFTGAQAGALITRHTSASGVWRPVVETAAGEVPRASPVLAFDASGNGLAAWATRGEPNELVFAAYDQASGTWGARAEVPRSTSEFVGNPSLALSPEGDGLIAWTSQEPGPVLRLRASTYSSGTGFPDVASALISDGATEPPAVIFDGKEYVVAWTDSDGTNATVWSSRRQNGTWLDQAERSTGPTGVYVPPRLGADASGNLMLLMRSRGQTEYEAPIFSRYQRSSGMWSGPAPLLNEFEYQEYKAPSFAVSPNGVTAAVITYVVDRTAFEFESSVVIFE